jgi:aminopeptidase N
MDGVPSLTHAEAVARAALLDVEAYELDVDLTAAEDGFRSTTTIRFNAANPGAGSFVEVRPIRLIRVTLNGADLDPATLAGGRLPLPGLAARNTLTVEAEFAYTRQSEGMHRFVDPADGATYLYAQPAIAQAPRFMACFDQPDLKAPVTVRATADPSWRVRGNAPAHRVGAGRWELAPTPPLATYLITLVAGPYHEVTATHDGIPLGVYARASLAEHLQREAAELFEVTAACFDRFHELFGIRYPFGKYDQVFAPEFSWGAMEFPGCVVLRDEHVYRSAVTDAERQYRAVLVAHEMAHMWFGDLVTMRWWDDLWLNESFADYLGYRVVAEATRWSGAWVSYSLARKGWGYAADQRPSTHSVAAAEVLDTDAALANFDGISYAKGSAVLRQLVAWLGDEVFLSGLRRYFDAHAYGNATLADLLAALSRASGRDLTGWAEVWLRRSGVDTLRPAVTRTPDGRYDRVAVVRTAPAHDGAAVRRPHRIGVGVYRDAGAAVVRTERALVDVDPAADGGGTPVAALAGLRPGALLLVNDGDLTYAKIRMEPEVELAAALPRLADPLARALVWGAAWDACRDAELPAQRFLALVGAALPAETEPEILQAVSRLAGGPVLGRFLAPDQRPAARAALVAAHRAGLDRPEPDSGRQLAAARGFIECAGAAEAGCLAGWLAGAGVPPGLAVDADLRWALLLRLAVLGAAGEDEIAAEERRDRSDRGVEEATRCRAARPDPEAKRRAWEVFMAGRDVSNRIVVAAADGFWQPEHATLTDPYAARFFAEVGATAAWRGGQLLVTATRAAYPSVVVAPATLAAAEALLAADGMHPLLRRELVDATDDLRRALAARAVAVAADLPGEGAGPAATARPAPDGGG